MSNNNRPPRQQPPTHTDSSSPRFIPSDVLAARDFLQTHPSLQVVLPLFQISLILDANVIIAELIWLARTRRDPTARTALQEVIAARTVLPFAPRYLDHEVQGKIPEVSRDDNHEVEFLQRAHLQGFSSA